jgi:serine phosphatase RsbU (regulator of sigma subunit)
MARIFSNFSKSASSLKTKITILVVFIISAILLSIGYLQIERDKKLHRQYLDERADTIAKTILYFNVLGVRNPNYLETERFLYSFLEQEDFAQDIVYIALLDDKAAFLAAAINKNVVNSYTEVRQTGDLIDRLEVPIETQSEAEMFIDKLVRNRVSEVNNNLIIYDTTLGSDAGVEVRSVSIGFSKKSYNIQLFNAVVVNFSIFSIYMVIGVLASVFLGGAISKPIKILENAMKQVSAGNLQQRLEITSRDEIGTLAATFNYMTEGLREKEKIKKEFLVARDVQFNLLPRKIISDERLDIATYFEPATEVGGDYYDFLRIDDDRLGIVIADVAGHGMSAGLMMAITKSCLHTQLTYRNDVSGLLESMNQVLFKLSEKRSMVTMFYSELDLKQGIIKFANAGHPYTYLIKASGQKLTALESTSYPLAVKEELKFVEQSRSLESGDYLVYYSDGIIEALNEEEEVFGFEKLEHVLCKEQYESSEDLLETLIAEVRYHIGTAEQYDDITAVVIRIK